MDTRYDLVDWVVMQVEGLAQGVFILSSLFVYHPHTDYTGMGMLLQLEWKYMQHTILEVV